MDKNEPVEKAATGQIASSKPGSKRPKTGLSVPERRLERDTKEFFNRLGTQRRIAPY
jgi:hypothetical protein